MTFVCMKKEYDFSKEELEEILDKYVNEMGELFSNPTNPIRMTKENLRKIDVQAGVYGIYDKRVLIYVGETRCLNRRMSDIFKTLKHTFRRSLGEFLFVACDDYTNASTRNKFCERIELELDTYFENNLFVFWLPVLVGRKEIEERIKATNNGLLNIN